MSKSGGHSTTTITRPKDASRDLTRDATRDGDRDDSRFADFTRPISKDKHLVQGKGKRGIIALGAFVILAALVAALFVLPVKAWMRQQDDIDAKTNELARLEDANASLTGEVDRLQTPEGIEEAAREEIGYVQRGETRLTVLPGATAPPSMPTGWPYDALTQIVWQRAVDAQPAASTP